MMTDMRRLLVSVAVIVVGCGDSTSADAVDAVAAGSFGPWRGAPISFDPAFAAITERACEATAPGATPILHDLRGAGVDILLFVGPGTGAFCETEPDDAGIIRATADGRLNGPRSVAPRPGEVTVETQGTRSSLVGEGRSSIFGRTGLGVGRVRIHLEDGREVTATVANGWFAAWWPGEVYAKSISVDDAFGLPFGTFEI